MTTSTIRQLEEFGPDRCETLSVEQARAWCRRLATTHYENFSVLSSLVPRDCRDDFASVYAFCRWADDLGDHALDASEVVQRVHVAQAEMILGDIGEQCRVSGLDAEPAPQQTAARGFQDREIDFRLPQYVAGTTRT